MLLTHKPYLHHVCYTYTPQLVLLQVFRHTSLVIQTCETLFVHYRCVIRLPSFKPRRLETRREPPALLESQALTFVTNLSSLVARRD